MRLRIQQRKGANLICDGRDVGILLSIECTVRDPADGLLQVCCDTLHSPASVAVCRARQIRTHHLARKE